MTASGGEVARHLVFEISSALHYLDLDLLIQEIANVVAFGLCGHPNILELATAAEPD